MPFFSDDPLDPDLNLKGDIGPGLDNHLDDQVKLASAIEKKIGAAPHADLGAFGDSLANSFTKGSDAKRDTSLTPGFLGATIAAQVKRGTDTDGVVLKDGPTRDALINKENLPTGGSLFAPLPKVKQAVGPRQPNRTEDIRNLQGKLATIGRAPRVTEKRLFPQKPEAIANANANANAAKGVRTLLNGVRAFQQAKGLKPDSLVNPGGPTEKALDAQTEKARTARRDRFTDVSKHILDSNEPRFKDITNRNAADAMAGLVVGKEVNEQRLKRNNERSQYRTSANEQPDHDFIGDKAASHIDNPHVLQSDIVQPSDTMKDIFANPIFDRDGEERSLASDAIAALDKILHVPKDTGRLGNLQHVAYDRSEKGTAKPPTNTQSQDKTPRALTFNDVERYAGGALIRAYDWAGKFAVRQMDKQPRIAQLVILSMGLKAELLIHGLAKIDPKIKEDRDRFLADVEALKGRVWSHYLKKVSNGEITHEQAIVRAHAAGLTLLFIRRALGSGAKSGEGNVAHAKEVLNRFRDFVAARSIARWKKVHGPGSRRFTARLNSTEIAVIEDGKTIRQGNSTRLGNNILRDHGYTASSRWTGYAAHHIIPINALENADILKVIRFDLDHSSNGVFLPRSPAAKGGSIHRSNHQYYSDAVIGALNKLDPAADPELLKRQVAAIRNHTLRGLTMAKIPLYGDKSARNRWAKWMNKTRIPWK